MRKKGTEGVGETTTRRYGSFMAVKRNGGKSRQIMRELCYARRQCLGIGGGRGGGIMRKYDSMDGGKKMLRGHFINNKYQCV